MTARYATPAAFRAAVDARLRTAATASGRPVNELRRQFLTQRFLARVYTASCPEWILLGGSALLVRIPGVRHSRGIDFARSLDVDLADAVTALTALIDLSPAPDPYRFNISIDHTSTDDAHVRLKVAVRLGASTVDHFPVDITCRPAFSTIDAVRPRPIIDIDDVEELPPFLMAPVAQQIADKLCAMYERHGIAGLPWSRWRDLVDLMLITTRVSDIKAAAVSAAVAAEQHRRGMTIPATLHAPSDQWSMGYRLQAKRLLPQELHSLSDAIRHLQTFAGPVLAGTASGTWRPVSNQWTV